MDIYWQVHKTQPIETIINKGTSKCGMNRHKQLFLIDFLFSPNLIFNLLRFKAEGSHQTCFAQLSFCLTSGIF